MSFKKLPFILFFLSVFSHAKLNVVVTIPEFKEIFEAVGGELIEVKSLLDGSEDPHYVDALPTFVTKVAKADIVCSVGLDLEVGWLPKVLAKSGNAKVQMGGDNFCELGACVEVIEKHTQAIDRSMGDVHPGGNPHFYLSPSALKSVADKIFELLLKNMPSKENKLREGLASFKSQMDMLRSELTLKLNKVSDTKIIQFHKEFSYFLKEYGLQSTGAIEEKPGVPPSSARISKVSLLAKETGVQLALGSFHAPRKYLRKFQEISGVSFVIVPSSVQLNKKEYSSISRLQHFIADVLVKQMRPLNADILAR